MTRIPIHRLNAALTRAGRHIWSIDGLSVFLLAVSGLALRLRHLTPWLNYDECQHYLVAMTQTGGGFFAEMAERAHPPLTYLLMKPFLWFGSNLILVKGLSLVCGLVQIVLRYLILLKLVRHRLAAFFATLFAANLYPYVVQSVEVRQYALCLVFVLASWLLVLRAPPTTSVRSLSFHVILGILCLAALITEYGALFHVFPLALVLYLPVSIPRFFRWPATFPLRYALPIFLSLALAAPLFLLHFGFSIPSYGHTVPYMYDGNFADLKNILVYGKDRLLLFADGLIPFPSGIFLLLSLPSLFLIPVFSGLVVLFFLVSTPRLASLPAIPPEYREGRRIYQRLRTRATAPLITEWRGSAIASWWYLPGIASRISESRKGYYRTLSFEDVPVYELDKKHTGASFADAAAGQDRLMVHRSFFSLAEAREDSLRIHALVENMNGLIVDTACLIPFPLKTNFMRLRRVTSPRQAE